MVVNFDLNNFPSHVSEERLHAYRPLVIQVFLTIDIIQQFQWLMCNDHFQDALSKIGAIIFLECDQRFVGDTSKINELYKTAAEGIGIVAWPTRPAVSSLTHPKMFEYFHTDADNFLFLPMVKVVQLVVVRSTSITKHIMLPWVQCALTQDCIFPIGESVRCNLFQFHTSNWTFHTKNWMFYESNWILITEMSNSICETSNL